MKKQVALLVGAFVALMMVAIPAVAKDEWLNAVIMPKTGREVLARSRPALVRATEIAWPVTVTRREGQWLYVRDSSGYLRQTVEGWISTDDVVKLSASLDHYNLAQERTRSAELYWLKGIYWETNGERNIAAEQYSRAIAADPRLADAYLRLARIHSFSNVASVSGSVIDQLDAHPAGKRDDERRKPDAHEPEKVPAPNRNEPDQAPRAPRRISRDYQARSAFHEVSLSDPAAAPSTSPVSSHDWEAHFRTVQHLRGEMPRLYYEWGEALRRHYQAGRHRADQTCYQAAAGHLEVAAQLNESFHLVHLAHADLFIARGQYQPAASAERTDSLRRALVKLDAVISGDPNAVEAYRRRAEVYYLLNEPDLAWQSAQRACQLTEFRAPKCLRVLAEVYYARQDYQQAINYVTKAASFADVASADSIQRARERMITHLATQGMVAATTARSADVEASRGGPAPSGPQIILPAVIPSSLSAAPE